MRECCCCDTDSTFVSLRPTHTHTCTWHTVWQAVRDPAVREKQTGGRWNSKVLLEYGVQLIYYSSLRLKSTQKDIQYIFLPIVTTDIHIGCMGSTYGNSRMRIFLSTVQKQSTRQHITVSQLLCWIDWVRQGIYMVIQCCGTWRRRSDIFDLFNCPSSLSVLFELTLNYIINVNLSSLVFWNYITFSSLSPHCCCDKDRRGEKIRKLNAKKSRNIDLLRFVEQLSRSGLWGRTPGIITGMSQQREDRGLAWSIPCLETLSLGKATQTWPFTGGHRVQSLQGQIPFKRQSYLLKTNSFTKLCSPEKDNALQLFTHDVSD